MDHTEPADFDVDDGLRELLEKCDAFAQRCLRASAHRVAREAARLAKDNRRLVPYLDAQFRLMNNAQGQLDAERGKEAALETISYLESEDRARVFQADFPEEEYRQTVGWMSACAYDNLAKHVAAMQGYNSEGMHQCITDGIDVCRRTGKLRCLTCFREYATDVYLASDDVPMALHFARMVRSIPEDAPSSERRWVGAKDETWILTLQGYLAAAEESANRALELAEAYHTPLEAKHTSLQHLETIRLMAGRHRVFVTQFKETLAEMALPRGEWIEYDLEADKVAALHACFLGDFQKAEELLVYWDRWLTEHRDLHNWFEVRLRLIACHRLAGAQQRVEPLAKQLQERAKKARDWLTLHRLSRLLDPSETPTPLASLAPVDAGPYAGNQAGNQSGVSAPPPQVQEKTAVPTQAPEEAPPLEGAFNRLVQRLQAVEDDAGRQAVLGDVLVIPTQAVTHPEDAARLLHFLTFVLADDPTVTREAVWNWAQTVAAPFPQVAAVLSLLACLGDSLRSDEALAELIPAEKIDQLFRESVDLDPFHPGNHFRAGAYHLGNENLGEAERCLARGFRLQRDHGPLALRLAEVYSRTERPRDALMVLDTCLREGCDDAGVAWEAANQAMNLRQYEPLLTYLDRHEQLQPGQPWINYYRAIGLLELGRPREALAAVEEEARRAEEHTLPLHALRACAAAMLDQLDEARVHLAEVLGVRLAEVDYLTFSGLCNLFARLWSTVGVKLSADEPLRGELEQHLLATGLAPDDYFEPHRQGEVCEDVHFYRCRVRQPFDATWPSSASCLAGQEQWPYYDAAWGVLARTEEEAGELAVSWQTRCGSLPCELAECDESEETYTDRVGIVWQGPRWCEEE